MCAVVSQCSYTEVLHMSLQSVVPRAVNLVQLVAMLELRPHGAFLVARVFGQCCARVLSLRV